MASNVVERSFTSNMQHGEEAAAVQCVKVMQLRKNRVWSVRKTGVAIAASSSKSQSVIVELGLAFPNLKTDRETELVVVRGFNSKIVGLMNNSAPGVRVATWILPPRWLIRTVCELRLVLEPIFDGDSIFGLLFTSK